MSHRRLPAEWEPQDGVLVAWPHERSDWRPWLAAVEPVFTEIVRQISRFETALVVIPEPERERITGLLEGAGTKTERVSLFGINTNDTWARDFGPITVEADGRPCLLDFGFNGWGLKFAADQDNQITARLQAAGVFGRRERRIPGLILEGGSIESDGTGTLLTTAECLLNPNRNPHLSRGEVQEQLARLLGARIFPGHDPEFWKTVTPSPDAYR